MCLLVRVVFSRSVTVASYRRKTRFWGTVKKLHYIFFFFFEKGEEEEEEEEEEIRELREKVDG